MIIDPGEQEKGRGTGSRRRRGNPDGSTRDQEDLFTRPVLETPTQEIRGMVREQGSIETQRAAVDALKGCEWIRWRLMQILTTEGPQNARQLESRNEFRRFGVCTVRKRITELKQAAERGEPGVVQVGRLDKMALWGVAPVVPK